VRISLIVEYLIGDAAVYYTRSANANDALFIQMRRALLEAARRQSGPSIAASPEVFAGAVRDAATPDAVKLGFEIVEVQVVEAVALGWVRQGAGEHPDVDYPSDTIIH
jgi:hypothetical protein